MSQLSYMEKLLDGVDVEWKALAELGELVRGNGLPKADFTTSGVPAIHYGQIYTHYGLSTETTISYVSPETARKLKKVNTGDVVITNTSENLEDVGKALVYLGNSEAVTGGHATIFKPNKLIIGKYFAYFTQTSTFFSAKRKLAKGTKVIDVSATDMAKIQIPIPCPDNPEKSLAIQSEIVRILDKFTALTAELTAELNMRKKQYNYYQFELLKFTETTQQLSIGECCDIKKGVTPIKKATPGKYPLVATTEERQSSSGYQFDCPAVCVPLISSRGHGVASIDRIYYQDGKFALGNILCAIIPNDSEMLSAKFLRYYLFDKKDVLLVPLMRGGANVSLTVDSLKKVKIPIPPKADQQRIVRALDKFDEFVKALPCEIELRQRQYEYYRDLLLSFPKPEAAA
nr:restriction endonuclease subunit S [Providencia rettgeri]ELR5088786.1 restriction endonuclease subunit S [Providencia rettgeri]